MVEAGALQIPIQVDIASLKASMANLEAIMKGAETTAKKSVGSVSSFFADAGKQALGFFSATAALEFGKAVLTSSMELEKASIAMETMIGNATVAKKLMGDLATMGAATPFETGELINASKTLITFGVSADEVVTKLTNLGNASQGNAQAMNSMATAYGRMKSDGVASLEELNKFTDAGVPIMTELAKKFGVGTLEIKKMSSEGKIGFKEIDAALTKLTTGQGQFAGMMEKQSQSLSGLMSTANDNVMNLGRSILEISMPAIKLFVEGIGAIANGLNDMNPSTSESIKLFAGIAAGAAAGYVAYTLFTSGLTMARNAMAMFNAVALANPALLASAAIGAAIGGIVMKYRELKAEQESMKELRELTEKNDRQQLEQYDFIKGEWKEKAKSNVIEFKLSLDQQRKLDEDSARKGAEWRKKRIEGNNDLMKRLFDDQVAHLRSVKENIWTSASEQQAAQKDADAMEIANLQFKFDQERKMALESGVNMTNLLRAQGLEKDALVKEQAANAIGQFGITASQYSDISQNLAMTTSNIFGTMIEQIQNGQLKSLSDFKEYAKASMIQLITIVENTILAMQIKLAVEGIGFSIETLGASAVAAGAAIAAITPYLAVAEGLKAGIRAMATGGIVTAPTMALIGEGKDHEAVLPLNDSTFAALARGITNQQNASGGDYSSTSNRTINLVLDGKIIGQHVDKYRDQKAFNMGAKNYSFGSAY